ncbi:hypothetical protein KOR34_02400 [Posidoniimonas corsicana]|uniref:Uncharacterized protein n=1 Tax=Posidoniimonas corsicana TaxID=1938618 RepID=A0A5C5VBY5_9BACT|nr:hypothetical protein [Posidoniimonas corsicana]TWT35349.1 hypothetical protein KOR34_02400 [Posidoniimonas corsicana]
MSGGLNRTGVEPTGVLTIDYLRGGERYRFVFRAGQRDQVRRLLARYAGDPSLAFSWYDAVKVGSMIKQGEQAQPSEQPTLRDVNREPEHGRHLPYCNCGHGDANHCACRSEAMAIALYGASFAVVLALLSLLL